MIQNAMISVVRTLQVRSPELIDIYTDNDDNDNDGDCDFDGDGEIRKDCHNIRLTPPRVSLWCIIGLYSHCSRTVHYCKALPCRKNSVLDSRRRRRNLFQEEERCLQERLGMWARFYT